MGLRIVEDDNLHARPVVFCDQCEQQITDANDGNYAWRMNAGESTPMWFTHKRCTGALERELLDTTPANVSGNWPMIGTMELRYLPVYMTRNLNIDFAKAEKQVDSMGGSGL